MQKLYCFVDETGQDTEGAYFLAALVISGKECDDLRQRLIKIEQKSGKITRKWTHTPPEMKQAYLQGVFNEKEFYGKLCFQKFSQTTDYLTCIIAAIANGITRYAKQDYKAVILIDGLGREERKIVGKRLRLRQIRTEKVRGARDESEALIRLADALAGFVRDADEGQFYARKFYRQAISNGIIVQL
jgi:hypothetical protein